MKIKLLRRFLKLVIYYKNQLKNKFFLKFLKFLIEGLKSKNKILFIVCIYYFFLKIPIFFSRSPSFSLNIVDPETSIFAPASFAKVQLSKFIPPSISISIFKLFMINNFSYFFVFSKTSGINF